MSETGTVGISAEKIIVSHGILIVELMDTFVLDYNYRGEGGRVRWVFWQAIVAETHRHDSLIIYYISYVFMKNTT